MLSKMSTQSWENILEHSECLASKSEVLSAINDLAEKITADYQNKNPLILCLMNGGLFLTSELTQRLSFPLRIDYLHATRYRGNTTGSELQWLKMPSFNLANEHVLIVDDVYDEGITLKEVEEKLSEQMPASIKTLVLVNKEHARKPRAYSVNYVGMNLEDKYLFGCGMDYHGHWRHLPQIYALKS